MSNTRPFAKFAAKYSIVIGSLLFLFTNFIACGSQMYQVSLEEDFDDQRTITALQKQGIEPIPGIHAAQGWKNLPIRYKIGESMNLTQKAGLRTAMARWEWAVGKKLFDYNGTHSGTTGDSFVNLAESLDDQVNGNYLDSDWGKTNKSEYVLATTIWTNTSSIEEIATADIRFNSEFYEISDSLNLAQVDSDLELVDMESLALHELGHLLGLGHIDEEIDPYSIMNPRLYIGEGQESRYLSTGDIKRIQQIYGCAGDACDIEKLQLQQNDPEVMKLKLSLTH